MNHWQGSRLGATSQPVQIVHLQVTAYTVSLANAPRKIHHCTRSSLLRICCHLREWCPCRDEKHLLLQTIQEHPSSCAGMGTFPECSYVLDDPEMWNLNSNKVAQHSQSTQVVKLEFSEAAGLPDALVCLAPIWHPLCPSTVKRFRDMHPFDFGWSRL